MVGGFRQRIGRDISAAMARRTVVWSQWPSRAGMAHCRRGKGCRVLMAGIALRRGRNMVAGLALGGDAVAGRAAAGDWRTNQIVIEDRPGKGGVVLVADVALRGRG